MKEEKFFKSIIKSADVEMNPAEEVKNRIFRELQYELNIGSSRYSFYENYLLERILKLSVPITILITVCTGISAA